jgi:predicted MFS family arabinose efflux permease
MVSLVLLIMGEGVNDMLAVVYGFSEVQLGILASALALTGALASYIAGKFSEEKLKKAFILMIFLYSLTLVVSPVISAAIGTALLFVRIILSPVLHNEISTSLNEKIDSKNRATALSTFTMLKGIPYAVLIYAIGHYADAYPIQGIASMLGAFMILAGTYNFFVQRKITQQSQG